MDKTNEKPKCDPCMGQIPLPPKPPKCHYKKPRCERCCDKEGFVFRKVTIPAVLGDDITGEYKAENGLYVNSYVVYEINDAQYIYDSDGIYTKLPLGRDVGVDDFNALINRPLYAGVPMTGDTSIPDVALAVGNEAALRAAADGALTDALSQETSARQIADTNLQSQIDAISASSDVTDIVGTYAELQAYDTSTLGDKDIIKVLQDESRNDETTYYRWSTTTQSFTLIGEEGPYYTKSQVDTQMATKLSTNTTFWGQSVQNNIVSGDITLTPTESLTWGVNNPIITGYNMGGLFLVSGTLDTDATGQKSRVFVGRDAITLDHYENGDWTGEALLRGVATGIANTDAVNKGQLDASLPTVFTGTDGTTAGTSGLVPAPATTDADKFLKSDGTWASGGGQVVFVSTTSSNPLRVYNYPAGTTFVATSQTTQYVRFTNTSSTTYDRRWSGFMYWNGTYCYMLNSRGLWTYFNGSTQGIDYNGISQFGALPVRVLDQSDTANRITLKHTATSFDPQMFISGSYSKEPLCAYYTSNYLSRNSRVKITNDTTYWLRDTGELLVVSTFGDTSESGYANSYVNTIVFYTDKTTGEPVMTMIKHLNNGTEISKTDLLAGGGVQSNWDENDSAEMSYIQNRTHYTESVDSTFAQGATTDAGATTDPDYVWLVEQFQDYTLSTVIPNFFAGDTVQMTVTYSVDGVEKTDSGNFILSIEGGEYSLDSDAPAGDRWSGAYVTEISGATTFRWPVSLSDSSGTVYITGVTYTKVNQLDAKYIPIDGTTIVESGGKLTAVSSASVETINSTDWSALWQ